MDNQIPEDQVEKELESTVKELISKMGFEAELQITMQKEGEKETFVCNVKTNDSNFLIGQYGVNLQSLQHIARILVRKRVSSKINFILDVNSYRQEKNDSIIKLAKSLAEECLAEKRAIVLRPMSPYERRMVHLELSKNDQVKTESIGEGEDRRVVIKPANMV